MHIPIISIAQIERKAMEAHAKRTPAGACPFPPSSAAAKTWHEVYARLPELVPA